MYTKLSIFTIIQTFLISILILWQCGTKNDLQPWNPSLSENTLESLNRSIILSKGFVDDAQKAMQSGKQKKAKESMKNARIELEKIETIIIPMYNCKSHISSAYQHITRHETNDAELEFKKARIQMNSVKTKATGTQLQNITEIITMIENLEKEVRTLKKQDYSKFITINEKIDIILKK